MFLACSEPMLRAAPFIQPWKSPVDLWRIQGVVLNN